MQKQRIPAYCRQRERGRIDRAFCRIHGKKLFLGEYGSPESRLKYAEVVASQPCTADEVEHHEPTVSEVMAAYLEHAARYYRKHDGTPGREYELIADICKYLRRQAGSLSARDYGPRMLKAVRQKMVDAGLSRKYINKQIDRVWRMFRWAAGEEMIPPSVPQALSMVTGLRKGRSDARETEPIRPVDPETISATMDKLPQVVADMVRVQLFTGMRPGELL